VVFSDQITIQQDSSTGDNPAEDFSGDALVAAMPCRVVDVRGFETYRGRQLVAQTEYLVELWQYPGIRPNMRLSVTAGLHAGKLLNISHVQDFQSDGSQPMTTLSCSERTELT